MLLIHQKTEKITNWPTPSSKKEVQQFLGLAGYYRRFIKDFATIAKPLHKLAERSAAFNWTGECEQSFLQLKEKLTSSPVLAFPNFNQTFILDTDASNTGIGAVLSQMQEDGSEKVIAYASRLLGKHEKRYCVTRRELLAVVHFIHLFRPYLLGKEFILRTDHGSLTWLTNFREPEGQLARWLERLQEYNFKVIHRRGKKHSNADALSRMPCQQCGRESHDHSVIEAIQTIGTVQLVGDRTSAELYKLQLDDPVVGAILRAKEIGKRPPDQSVNDNPKSRRLLQLWDQLVLNEKLLFRKFESQDGTLSHLQLVVPEKLQKEVLNELHGGELSGHLGEEKTLSRLKERFYWPGHWNDVRDWCNTCPTCATRKFTGMKHRAPLQTIKSGYPMQVVAVDILGPLPESDGGNRYILVAGDYFTKWMEAYAIPNQEAKTVAERLVNELFCRFSPPEQLHSDQGRQFESELLTEVCKLLNIHKTRTTPYHPQCDGLVERFNRTLLNMLARSTKDHPFDWEMQLPKVCMAYNTSVQSSTGYSPFFLMFGRKAKLPIDLMYGFQQAQTTTNEYVAELQRTISTAYQHVREKVKGQHERQKEYYNRKIHGKPYSVGDLVWLYSPVVAKGRSKKLHHPWLGPYMIIKKLSDVTYRIQHCNNKKKRMVVHFDRLKPCHPGTRFPDIISRPDKSIQPTVTSNIGDCLELVDDDIDHTETPTQRYPTRTRYPPDRYGTVIIY